MVEERKFALESCNSKNMSASVAQTKVDATPSNALDEMKWEPPRKCSDLNATGTEREAPLGSSRYDRAKQSP